MMREYRIYLGSESGAFGHERRVWLTSDDIAIRVGRRLLNEIPGVDIWRGERRVALLLR